jgi:hypothetical protein
MNDTVTMWLRFADADEYLAAFLERGMAVTTADVETGTERLVVPSPGYLDGVRFDAIVFGGDGVYRVQDGVEAVDMGDLGIVEMPRFVARSGYHVDLVWHGVGGDAPDFSAFVATARGAWAYDDDPAAAIG